jgi:hypothetical protein
MNWLIGESVHQLIGWFVGTSRGNGHGPAWRALDRTSTRIVDIRRQFTDQSAVRPRRRPRATSLAALACVLAGATGLSAQAGAQAGPPMKHETSMASSGWKELDNFHVLIAATWHPIEKSNDFKPARQKAAELADAAQAWSSSKVPAACNTKQTRDAMAAVALEARILANHVVQKASDDTVRRAMKTIHSRFETAERNCQLKTGKSVNR